MLKSKGKCTKISRNYQYFNYYYLYDIDILGKLIFKEWIYNFDVGNPHIFDISTLI